MNNIENTYGMLEVTFTKQISAYCPIGKDYYTAKIGVLYKTNDILVDYCKADEFLNGLGGEEAIVEELVTNIYDYFKHYAVEDSLRVTVHAESNTHFPVTVTKIG